MSHSITLKYVRQSISRTIRNFLGRQLRICLKKVTAQRKSQSYQKERVYDILNVQDSSRFVGVDGQIYHNCVLSVSYLMTAIGLAARLTEETGKEWTEDQAQELIDLFDETYHVFAQYRRDSIQDYYDQNFAALPDGWTMWGDNEKFRSVGNFPIQGMGACIMRKAVALAQDRGLNVIFTLHDAIYIEYVYGDLSAIDTLKECMLEAFCSFFEGEMKEQAEYIRVDPQTWSEEYPEPTISDKGEVIYSIVKTPQGIEVPASSYFIDARAGKEFDKFKKYMFESSGQDLLI
jgi:hypothetical protein